MDDTLDISDVVFSLTALFLSGTPSVCEDAADANDDGVLDISDSVLMLAALFISGTALPEPAPGCGLDPSSDSLGCAASHCP